MSPLSIVAATVSTVYSKFLLTGLNVDRYATCALLVADHAAGFPDYRSHDSIEWGTWRCNSTALALLGCDLCGVLPTHHLVSKLTSSFCGALSAFGSTTDQSVRLMRHGRLAESMLNLGLNVATVLLLMKVVLCCNVVETAVN